MLGTLPQAELAQSRSAADAAAAEATSVRVEADSLRKALRAMEARLAEYQAKDTEVRGVQGQRRELWWEQCRHS